MSKLQLGLLGEHLNGSQTPALHETEARRHGLELSYSLLDAAELQGGARDWGQLLRHAVDLGYTGLNVTHPAKQAVLPVIDSLSPEAELLGAVNTVVLRGGRMHGENTDHTGFALSLKMHSIPTAQGPVVQLGAGGAGSAVAFALLRSGAPSLSIVDVDRARALALKHRLAQVFEDSRISVEDPADVNSVIASACGLVNCTPVGMHGVSSASPVDVSVLRPDLWVGDVIYRPLITCLVRAAQDVGATAFGGASMVVGQAAAAFELFTGCAPNISHMQDDFSRWMRTPPTPLALRSDHRWVSLAESQAS